VVVTTSTYANPNFLLDTAAYPVSWWLICGDAVAATRALAFSWE
jgi:hypothetical protein